MLRSFCKRNGGHLFRQRLSLAFSSASTVTLNPDGLTRFPRFDSPQGMLRTMDWIGTGRNTFSMLRIKFIYINQLMPKSVVCSQWLRHSWIGRYGCIGLRRRWYYICCYIYFISYLLFHIYNRDNNCNWWWHDS